MGNPSVGLRENVDKVVALAKGIRRGQQLPRHLPESVVFFTSILSGWRMETFIAIWVFPKIGVPPNHPFWGTPIFGNTHMNQ